MQATTSSCSADFDLAKATDVPERSLRYCAHDLIRSSQNARQGL